MAYRFGEQFALGEPVRRAAMQFGLRGAVAAFQARGEEVAEQRMKAIPGLAVIGLDAKDQQIVFVQALQHGLRRVTAGHRLRQRGIEAPADADAFHEGRKLGGQMGHDVFSQVALQVVGAPAHFAQRATRIRIAAQEDDDQLQGGRPAAGELVDLVQFLRAEL
ncbi:hypothetical protein D3C79_765790 [compost metagenome]